MVGLTALHLRACQRRFGARLQADDASVTLGSVTLWPHQVDAAARVAAQLDRWGGCLLADPVGQSKTYTALAVARRWRSVLVVVPASMRTTWRAAMRRAGVDYPLVTHEALSRGLPSSFAPDGVVVDESHHYRNRLTRRHAALASASARAELLLLSATPVQNGVRDLAAQLSLFLGSAAWATDAEVLARHVVRVTTAPRDLLPATAMPRWIHPAGDDGAVLHHLVALPRPPAAIDAGEAGALRLLGLVRAWASSRAALIAMLRRRRRQAIALDDVVGAGRLPSRQELALWTDTDADAVQLGFGALLVERPGTDCALATLRAVIHDDLAALATLDAAIGAAADPDPLRVAALLDIVSRHPGEPVLAFTHSAATARMYWNALRHRAGVGLLTARGGQIASGAIARDALLQRFAPTAQGVAAPHPRERVALLVATDLLSEGVNLQDAGVVVHLDLPWNPARLEQRLGRIRRPHGRATIASYLVAPPALAERCLEVEALLRAKIRSAEATIGASVPVLPTLTIRGLAGATDNAAAPRDVLASILAGWCRGTPRQGAPGRPLAAAAEAPIRGWLALLDDGTLLCALEGRCSAEQLPLARAAMHASGIARPLAPRDASAAIEKVAAWCAGRATLEHCGVRALSSPIAARLAARIAHALTHAPRAERARWLSQASPLLARLAGPFSLGAERLLAEFAVGDTTLPLATLTQIHETLHHLPSRSSLSAEDPRPHALIVFGPTLEAREASPRRRDPPSPRPGSPIQDPDPRSPIPDPRSRIQDPESRIQDPEDPNP